MIQHTFTSEHPTLAAMVSIGVMLSILLSIVTISASGEIVTREQCMRHCVSQSASHSMPLSATHDLRPCCAPTPSFDMHTCHMDNTTESGFGMFEYPVPQTVRQNHLTIGYGYAAIDDLVTNPACEEHFVFHPLIQSPIPPYIQYLSFRR